MAAFCRSSANDISRLCEEDDYASWLNYLCDQGDGDELALKQVLKLTAFADEERLAHTAVISPAVDISSGTEGLEEVVLEDEVISQTPSKLESRDVPELPLNTFVVSISARTEFRRLHVTGGCPRVPGLHYANFEILGTVEPAVHSFHARCLHCCPESKGVREVDVEALGADSPTSSGESSDSVSE